MKSVVKWVVCALCLAGGFSQSARAEGADLSRTVKPDGLVLDCRLSETNLLAGGTTVLEVTLRAPAQLKVEFARLALHDFLVFGEEHPAYRLMSDGQLMYRQVYYLQARKPGPVSIPEIRVRFTDIINATEPRDLSLPAWPLTVHGLEIKRDNELQWSEPVEVSR
jgi:hypothetical protein